MSIINSETVCKCGRRLDRLHCPHCASRNIYALSSKRNRHTITDEHNQLIEREFMVARCRSCGQAFDEWELLYHCEAPELLVKMYLPKTAQPRHSINRPSNPQRVENAKRDLKALLQSKGVIDEYGNKIPPREPVQVPPIDMDDTEARTEVKEE